MNRPEVKKAKIDKQTTPSTDGLMNQHELKILLVDVSIGNRLLIQAYLKRTPHHIDVAENGKIAVEKFMAGSYDIVLMDIQMPVMDGYAATREIRQWEGKQIQAGEKETTTPILALTAYALKGDEQRSLDAGCTAHLTKPIRKAKLIEAIDQQTSKE